ncbi:unnamed protein product [Allacma fusca]|uniref:Cytochrome P450 n=1 Tax=Allacma fusca TaxID=39272 RepID=A0A8J2LMN6_9HEXA|nr:unnamed protein product [Allacma fusca]
MYVEVVLLVLLGIVYTTTAFIRHRNRFQNFPKGPSGIPIFGYLPFLGKVPCQTLAELSKTYGKIFSLKLGQYTVVFIHDFELAKDAYRSEFLTGREQLALFEKRGVYGLGLLEGRQWQELNRFVMKCLRDLGFGKKSLQSSIMEEVVQTRSLLEKNTNKPLYLKPLIELAVVNALWGIITSEKYDIEDPTKRHALEIMSDGIADQNIVGIAAFLPWLAKLFPTYTGYTKGLRYFEAPEQLVKEVVQKHVDSYVPGTEKDFIDVMLTKIYSTTEPSSMFYKNVGMKNLHYTLIDLFFAGSDSMSSTLGWSFLYLSMWPEVQKKVQREIDAVIGPLRLPSSEDKSRLPYTEATMWEVLRKSSMVPLGLLHTATDNFKFEGYFFPRKTIFLTNLHFIHQDPLYWKDPENFRPERFINANGQFQRDEHMIPFFIGKRVCPGESLALQEYFLFFSGILQKFEFSLNPDEPVPDIGPRAGQKQSAAFGALWTSLQRICSSSAPGINRTAGWLKELL